MQIFISSLITEEFRIFCHIHVLLTHFMNFKGTISIKIHISSRRNLKNNSYNIYIATVLNYGISSWKLEMNQPNVFVIQFTKKKGQVLFYNFKNITDQ